MWGQDIQTNKPTQQNYIHTADVVFTIREKPHTIFTRSGDDLVLISPISLCAALTGTIVEVATLDGRTLQVPINDVVQLSNLLSVFSSFLSPPSATIANGSDEILRTFVIS